uniref:Uncharacterized protein n=1 Tax=Candidatus Kentrum sp. TC TaxID=2126339 RepID=A0A450ZEN9_9GAMM|nr:MAG: hypothetical protein BECKTC1821D_GA0114238_115910 [Candidatus Kentron sp. TC]
MKSYLIILSIFLVALFGAVSPISYGYSETEIIIAEDGITCTFNDCNLGKGNKSCTLTDSNGGVLTIEGLSRPCRSFIGKTIVWKARSRTLKAKIVRSEKTW